MLLPSGGAVYVEGMDTKREELLLEIRRRVGMVFQNPDNQIVANVVREDVAFGLENLGVPHEDMIPRIDAALAAVRMTERASFAPHMLSGGQKQRVAIAGVLAMQPEILVMDEPTAMLDPNGRAEVIQTIKKLNREMGMTVILITHYMDEAVQADRVIVVDSGHISMEGAPRDIFPQVDRLVDLGLDTPQSTYLIYMLNKLGLDFNPRVLNDKECAEELIKRLKKNC